MKMRILVDYVVLLVHKFKLKCDASGAARQVRCQVEVVWCDASGVVYEYLKLQSILIPLFILFVTFCYISTSIQQSIQKLSAHIGQNMNIYNIYLLPYEVKS